MATPARELVGWTEQRWTAVQEAVNRAIARTAKCRQVVPKGPEAIGATTVAIATVSGAPLELKDDITAPVALSETVQFDDQHSADEPSILRLLESAASALGKQEDTRILKGEGGVPRNAALVPKALATIRVTQIELEAADATKILETITAAVAEVEKERPGACGLILANNLLALLRQPVRAGEAPPLNQVEQLIGSSEIVGSSALDAAAGAVCGILFRLEPGAIDLVHTKLPTVRVRERTAGVTKLDVEEEIALRILDDKAIVQIRVKP